MIPMLISVKINAIGEIIETYGYPRILFYVHLLLFYFVIILKLFYEIFTP